MHRRIYLHLKHYMFCSKHSKFPLLLQNTEQQRRPSSLLYKFDLGSDHCLFHFRNSKPSRHCLCYHRPSHYQTPIRQQCRLGRRKILFWRRMNPYTLCMYRPNQMHSFRHRICIRDQKTLIRHCPFRISLFSDLPEPRCNFQNTKHLIHCTNLRSFRQHFSCNNRRQYHHF